MRSSYFILGTLLFVVAGTYWYQSAAAVCPAPLSYRVGGIDPSFNLTLEQAKSYALQAEAIWEGEVERDLFVYDEQSDFTIEFIFDERQATANSEETQRKELDKQKQESEEILQTVESLQAEYENLTVAYQIQVTEYEERLSAYNTEVNRYNDRGGAPPKEYESLETERQFLEDEADSLTKTAAELNTLAAKINRLSDRGNALVDSYNQQVNQYNSEFGFAREFTQGDYQGDRIHVYKFSSEAEVITVLTHEFGHALGIGHVEGSSSVMYYLLDNMNEMPALSPEDLAEYQHVCGLEESYDQKIRRVIRQVLATI